MPGMRLVGPLALLLAAGITGCTSNLSSSLPSSPTPSATASGSTPTLINDGSYTVGVDIQAGDYVAEPSGTSCYWARYDSSGDIIDNQVTEATRVTVTIKPRDSSFSTRGCGGWLQTAVADPNSPDDDDTPCGVLLVSDGDSRADIVTPFLLTLRKERSVTSTPTDKLVSSFAKRVSTLCGSDTWRDDEAATVGIAARVVYETYESEFGK